MSKPKMYQFMGSDDSSAVTVTHDPKIAEAYAKKHHASQQTDSENIGKIGNDQTNMAVASALGKDERIYKMLVAFDKVQLATITSIAQYLNVAYSTAKKYAQESGIMIYDDRAKKYIQGRLPKNFK